METQAATVTRRRWVVYLLVAAAIVAAVARMFLTGVPDYEAWTTEGRLMEADTAMLKEAALDMKKAHIVSVNCLGGKADSVYYVGADDLALPTDDERCTFPWQVTLGDDGKAVLTLGKDTDALASLGFEGASQEIAKGLVAATLGQGRAGYTLYRDADSVKMPDCRRTDTPEIFTQSLLPADLRPTAVSAQSWAEKRGANQWTVHLKVTTSDNKITKRGGIAVWTDCVGADGPDPLAHILGVPPG